MSHRAEALIAIVLAGSARSACGPESTSFRPTDRSDPDRAGPPSAVYDVRVADQRVALPCIVLQHLSALASVEFQ